jgi:hypothetical protein
MSVATKTYFTEMTTILGYCAVDSGQLMITDPSYISYWDDKAEFGDNVEGGHFSYPGACDQTLGKHQGGQLYFPAGHSGVAVVSGTGYGDGYYPVYATYRSEYSDEACLNLIDRRIAKLEIVFIDEDEEATDE